MSPRHKKSSLITATELEALRLQSPNLIILDVSPATNKSGLQTAYPNLQIPGARKANLKQQFSDQQSTWPNKVPSSTDFTKSAQQLGVNSSSQLVVYDNLGIYSAPRLWWLFRIMGHQNVAVLNGGLPAWIAAGFDTEVSTTVDFSPGDFEAILDASSVWSRTQVLENMKQPTAHVVDARSAGRFAGIAPEPRAGLPSGHIPGSCSLPFKEVLHNGLMKPNADLFQIFEERQLTSGQLVFSCGSGLTACIILLAADQVLEQSLSVFDGSWTEWASPNQDVRIIDIEAKKLLGVSRTTTMADPQATVLWRRFGPSIKNIKGKVTNYLFSLQNYPSADSLRKYDPNLKFEQWAAVEVTTYDNQPEELVQFELPAGRYAVHMHQGLPSDFPKTMTRIYGQWLPQSVYELDHRPHFERLAPDYRPDDPNAQEEIWIPLKK